MCACHRTFWIIRQVYLKGFCLVRCHKYSEWIAEVTCVYLMVTQDNLCSQSARTLLIQSSCVAIIGCAKVAIQIKLVFDLAGQTNNTTYLLCFFVFTSCLFLLLIFFLVNYVPVVLVKSIRLRITLLTYSFSSVYCTYVLYVLFSAHSTFTYLYCYYKSDCYSKNTCVHINTIK